MKRKRDMRTSKKDRISNGSIIPTIECQGKISVRVHHILSVTTSFPRCRSDAVWQIRHKYVILNGAQRSEESLPSTHRQERFFVAMLLRMTWTGKSLLKPNRKLHHYP